MVGSRRTQSVSNLEGGILRPVLVREGEVVEKGQVVAQLENVMAESSYRDALYKLVEHRLAIHAAGGHAAGRGAGLPQ